MEVILPCGLHSPRKCDAHHLGLLNHDEKLLNLVVRVPQILFGDNMLII